MLFFTSLTFNILALIFESQLVGWLVAVAAKESTLLLLHVLHVSSISTCAKDIAKTVINSVFIYTLHVKKMWPIRLSLTALDAHLQVSAFG